MKTDVQIAQEAKMLPISQVAEKLGINEDRLIHYGKYKAKVSLGLLEEMKDKPDGKLVLVTAINPTPAGEGKTTTNIGLSMGLNKIGKTTITALREPSLGPSFGVKGGAAGGGYSQVVPMEDINLHFTGDIHAMGVANNLLWLTLNSQLYVPAISTGTSTSFFTKYSCFVFTSLNISVLTSPFGGCITTCINIPGS